MNYYETLLNKIDKMLNINFSYYELREWRNHEIIEQKGFHTLKEAEEYYKKKNYEYLEDKGMCYIEIIHVKPLKKPNE